MIHTTIVFKSKDINYSDSRVDFQNETVHFKLNSLKNIVDLIQLNNKNANSIDEINDILKFSYLQIIKSYINNENRFGDSATFELNSHILN